MFARPGRRWAPLVRAPLAPAPASLRPELVVVAVGFLWGTIGVIVREVDLPAAAIVAVRVWVASLVLGGWLALRRDRIAGAALLSHRPLRSLAVGALLAGHWVALFAALQRAPIGIVLFVTYLAPVGVAVAAPRALGEAVGPRTVGALALGLAGAALLLGPAAGDASTSGLLLAGVAALSYVALMLVAKPLAETYGGLRLAFIEMTVAGIVLVPFVARLGWGPPQGEWLWLLVLGVVHTAVAIVLFLGALARLPATSVGILSYIEPAAAVLFGWLLLSERPGPATVAGGLLVIGAGALVIGATRQDVAGVPR